MNYKSEEIGKLIRAERKKLKMSQEEFAKKIEPNYPISVKQISNYENGKLIPPMDKLLKMCEVFDCELGYLLGEKGCSEGTKLKTIIRDKTGLNNETIEAIVRITGTERSCINWGYESEKYRRILNSLFTSKGFVNFVEALADLDDSYQKKEQEEKILTQLCDELGKPLFNKAMKLRDLTANDEKASDLTEEECDAIKKVNAALDECDKLHSEYVNEMKIHRFSLQEVITLLLNEMYPN